MSELKKCCRYCTHFQNGTCTRKPFVESSDDSAMLYKFINEGYLRKAITIALDGSDLGNQLFKHKTIDDKKDLIEHIAENIEDNAEALADKFYMNFSGDVFIADPDNFFCKYYI